MEAVHVLSSQNIIGEGPLWNNEEQSLYWVDITGQTINRYMADSKVHESYPVDSQVGVISFRQKGGLIVAGSKGFSFWKVGNPKLELINDPEADNPNSRFNDGKIDRSGRFWAGTMTSEGAVSSLYRMDSDLTIYSMDSGITISNGIGWSPDNRVMYFADSLRYIIYAYDYDLDKGLIENRRNFIEVKPEYGIPDGLTVDSAGYIWCAFYAGSKVTRFNPRGEIANEVFLPVTQPTSCIFGGKDYRDLYITTAWNGLSDDERKEQPLAGDLFMIKTDIKGLPEPKFRG